MNSSKGYSARLVAAEVMRNLERVNEKQFQKKEDPEEHRKELGNAQRYKLRERTDEET